jgi:thiol-disulfide isomerase/thioredoxin
MTLSQYELPPLPTPEPIVVTTHIDMRPVAVSNRWSNVGYHLENGYTIDPTISVSNDTYTQSGPQVHTSEHHYGFNLPFDYARRIQLESILNSEAVALDHIHSNEHTIDHTTAGSATAEDSASAYEHFVGRINTTRRVSLHYTNWCGACSRMKPVWADVKAALGESGIEFTEIDEDVAKTPGVNAYPTIVMLDENGYHHEYKGGPVFETLREWIVAPRLQNTN